MKYFPIALLLFLLVACGKPENPTADRQSKVSTNASVVTAHELASKAGLEILKQGGNAVDAAVASQFALAVVYPRAGNLGGGGFMVIRLQDGTVNTLDYREKAPFAATKDLFLNAEDEPQKKESRIGGLAVGVPGTPAGMQAAHEKYGKLSWEALLQPAINLAEVGFPISESEADRLNNYQETFKKTDEGHLFIDKWKAGDTLRQKKLAATLRRIQSEGSGVFYTGKIASLLAREVQEHGGIMVPEDLERYQPVWREPTQTNYQSYTLYSMPPPSSGGITLGQIVKMSDFLSLSEYPFYSADAMHIMIEAMRRAFADRARYLGDPDFIAIPQDSLLSSDYLESRLADFSMDTATDNMSLSEIRQFEVRESYQTTHTSIVDEDRNAVSVTTTLNSNYGSKVYVDSLGFFLNNEMDDFSIKPGVPNQFGLVGSEANAIAPEKRMLSSMTPTIVEKNDSLFLVLGAPGGPTIITAVLQVFLDVAIWNMDLKQAIEAGRFHHQYLPNRVLYERNYFPPEVLEKLNKRGHELQPVGKMAIVKAIRVLPNGNLHGAGDSRNPDDYVAGY